MARESTEDSEAFMTEVCWHYFVNEMTQAGIAKLMGVTRLRVNQTIQRARELGMVKIHIESPFLPCLELQQQLQELLGVERALVVPSNRENYDYHRSVGAGLAELVSERLRAQAWQSIGVSWGLTLDAAITRLTQQLHPKLEVVSILGGTVQGSNFNAFGIASGFARVLGAHYSILTSPIYLSKSIDRDLFITQSSIKEYFQKFNNLDAVILTCSDVSEKSFLVANGLPEDISIQSLIDSGAIGDVLGQFVDQDGNSVCSDIDSRVIGMLLEQVKSVPEKIMAAAGPHKVDIIRACSQRGLIDTLVTDDLTAEKLLDKGV